VNKSVVTVLGMLSLACTEPTVPGGKARPALRLPSFDVSLAAVTAVLPAGYQSVMGTSSNLFPHSWRNLRYQQVFLGTDLVDPTIVGLCLRRDERFGGTERLQTLRIKLGPTSMDYTNLGTSFDGNYSSAPTEVFAGDVLVSPATVAGTPADFDLCIPFTQEYEHPAGANVLVEVINTSIASANVLKDACEGDEALCTTKRIFAFSATATTATSPVAGGLIMKFISPDPPAPADPVTKDECMNGGWSGFGFRNQGQCVRLVETGEDSREPPAA